VTARVDEASRQVCRVALSDRATKQFWAAGKRRVREEKMVVGLAKVVLIFPASLSPVVGGGGGGHHL